MRVPPPISSAASRTVTSTPSAARVTAAASPLGPPPTTIAVVMPLRRCRGPPSRSVPGEWPARVARRTSVRGDRAVGQPRLLLDGVGHLPGAASRSRRARRRSPCSAASSAPGLRLHPDDDELAGLELPACRCTAAIRSSLCRCPSPKLKPIRRVADELALPDGARVDVGQRLQQHREQAAALAVHRPPCDARCIVISAHCGSISEGDELVDLVLAPRVTLFSFASAPGCERPHRRGPVAGVLPHRRQERHLVGPEVAQDREEQQRRDDRGRQPRATTCSSHGVSSPGREAENRKIDGVGEQHVPFQRHRERERRDDEQVEDHHQRRRPRR